MWWNSAPPAGDGLGIFLAALYAMILVASSSRPTICTPATSISSTRRRSASSSSTTGSFVGPFVYGRNMTLDMDTLKRDYPTTGPTCRRSASSAAASYQFWGLFDSDFHLVCPAENGQMFLLGTDRLGRDVLSRIIYGARISLTSA